MGGVKLKLVYPSDYKKHGLKFFYKNVPGAIEAHLANFG